MPFNWYKLATAVAGCTPAPRLQFKRGKNVIKLSALSLLLTLLSGCVSYVPGGGGFMGYGMGGFGGGGMGTEYGTGGMDFGTQMGGWNDGYGNDWGHSTETSNAPLDNDPHATMSYHNPDFHNDRGYSYYHPASSAGQK